jgi:hypothetical protein
VDSSKFKEKLALLVLDSSGSSDPQKLEIYDMGALPPTEQNADDHTIEIVNNAAYRPLPEEWTKRCVYGLRLNKPVCTC